MPVIAIRSRKTTGYFITESPVALWVLLVFMTFPFLDLATICLRSTFLFTAAHTAVEVASKAHTFQTSLSANDISAVQAAYNQATSLPNNFSEVQITSVKTYILATNINTQTVTSYATPLAQAPDTSNNVYHIQTVVAGKVSPLITYNGTLLGNIPGFTAPITLTATGEEFCEFPQGLTQ